MKIPRGGVFSFCPEWSEGLPYYPALSGVMDRLAVPRCSESPAGFVFYLFHFFKFSFHDRHDERLRDAIATFYFNRRVGHVIEPQTKLILGPVEILVNDTDGI